MSLNDLNWDINNEDFKKDWFYTKNSSVDNGTKISKRGGTSIHNELIYDVKNGSNLSSSVNNQINNSNNTKSSSNSTTSINNELIYDINDKSAYNDKNSNGFIKFIKENQTGVIIAGVSIILIALVCGFFIYKKKRDKNERIRYEKSKTEPDIEINTLIKHNSLPRNNADNNKKTISNNTSTSPKIKSTSEKQVPQQQQFINYIQPQLQVQPLPQVQPQPQTIIPLYQVPVPVSAIPFETNMYVNPSSSLDSKSNPSSSLDSKSKIIDDTKLKSKDASSQPYEAIPVDNVPIINPELRSSNELSFDEKKSLKEKSAKQQSIDDKLMYLSLVNNASPSTTFPILNEDKSINVEATISFNDEKRRF